jgi:hypothetical protein
VELLDEVSQSKITGEEERYSKLDLVDMAADVEGSERAFAAVRPALSLVDGGPGDDHRRTVRRHRRAARQVPDRGRLPVV